MRDEEPEALTVSRADGSYLFDARGRRSIDFIMGWCVGNLGWGRRDIGEKVDTSPHPTYVYPYYRYKRWDELARLLATIAPGKLERSFRATGGTEAVEIALQLAMVHTGRRKFLSIEGSYHGNSIATLSIGSSLDLLPNCHKIAPPLDEKALRKVETRLRRRDVAAFVMEPVIIALGVYVPDVAFMRGLQRLCRKYGTLLVIDEVATGFGRTGTLFASEHFDLQPDIMCLGKAISGGYAGLGATMTTAAVAKSAHDGVSAYSTYGWHPLSVEAAIANVRYWIRYRRKLLGNVEGMSRYFRTRLSGMKFVDVRIKGLAIAAEVKRATYAERIVAKCLDRGLLIASEGNALALFPALTIDQETARRGLDILQESL